MLSRAKAQRLAMLAQESGAAVLRGSLHNVDSNEWRLGNVKLMEWLADYEGQEVFLIVAPLADRGEAVLKTCRTCGRDYEGKVCPHCQKARERLRGR